LPAVNLRRRGKDPRKTIPFTFVFKGSPGTGKTHTARILGQIFYDMGFLSSSEVVECSASNLIGEHMGQSAPKGMLRERHAGGVSYNIMMYQ
jgi:AAA+ superfamily predicted ATPase